MSKITNDSLTQSGTQDVL